ncbi:family 43 glycosylhydrolase [Bacillus sp. EB106-08-02-XG196]|uniref:glycoside hydrolase family 43 protein n=1 Tax=Bacillus sp. EB106-08-02-XG196 TaxID=2737049 RepID=UPI0015C44553|nr:family 43 glycosylhydrolase [Bacillus sp. EB106-08-02-XG196]NWQ39119.1 family 43 glycosylhydrolase [Bacillus sp. EB106-08-02-XG196]
MVSVTKDQAKTAKNLIIEQRADPWVYKHTDGYYYFTASVPEYDGIEVRRSKTIKGIAVAEPVMVWNKHETGPMSSLIWAPEIHYINGSWYIYFAAAPSKEIIDGLFQHRMFVIENKSANPLEGNWEEKGQINTDWDSFALDATSFEHKGQQYLVWAQKDPAIKGNSNLYIAALENPWTIKGPQVMIAKPEFDWETIGFWVNEGPAVLKRNGKIFISFSGSATDENYAMGLLAADENSDVMDPHSWSKSKEPVFKTCYETGQYGPGHNSFTVSEDGSKDILVYHVRNYTEIVGDPLYDPNRHTCAKEFGWNPDGTPNFGTPE